MADDPYARIAELEAENVALRSENAMQADERSEARKQQAAAVELPTICDERGARQDQREDCNRNADALIVE